MLYIDASKLNFGDLYISDFTKLNEVEFQDLFSIGNLLAAGANSNVRDTTYALGRVYMVLQSRETREVSIVNDFMEDNDRATDYDWNRGGSPMREKAIGFERWRTGFDDRHGFRVYYYGKGKLNREREFTNVPNSWKQ